MCIVLYKPQETPVLKKKVYKRCFTKNSDGAGFAWWDEEDQTWQVQKGFMKFKHFWNAFNKHQFTENHIVITHFRIGTSGNRKGPDCTHPFPVTKDYDEMRMTEYSCPNIVFHNGVVGFGHDDKSDTMIAIKDYVNPLFPHMEEEGISEILGEVLEDGKCRWLITEGDDIFLYGKWLEDEKYGKTMFSNDGYKEPKAYTHPAPATTTDNHGIVYSYGGGTTRLYRSSAILQDFLGPDTLWDWMKWDKVQRMHGMESTDLVGFDPSESEPTGNVTPNEKLSFYDVPVTFTGYLDDEGNIILNEEYIASDDLPCCPSCGCEEHIDIQNGDGDRGCTQCGCVYELTTGEIIMYNPDLCVKDLDVLCPVCDKEITTNDWGECPVCESILEARKAEAQIKEQRGGI